VCFTLGFEELAGPLGLSMVWLFTGPMGVYASILVVHHSLGHKCGPMGMK
jgi:hypothetical protein